MKLDMRTILTVLVLILAVWLAFKVLKAFLPLILIAIAVYFGYRWYKNRGSRF